MNESARIAASDGLAAMLDVEMAEPVRAMVASMGRTEDVRFSPDNRRLAIAAFERNACFLFDLAIDRNGNRPSVELRGGVELFSDAIASPHGLDFIDDRTLLVGSRDGGLAVFTLPAVGEAQGEARLAPRHVVRRIGLFHALRAPGSVVVLGASGGNAEILVCNNYRDRVSRHTIPLRGRSWPPRGHIFLERGLLLPDGIAVSPDRAFIAVSNHLTRSVMIYDNRTRLKRGSGPSAVLFGADYPHGLRFSPDGRRLYVADAGSAFVCCYRSTGAWEGAYDPVAKLRVLEERTFRAGRHSEREGGPKGIDLTADGSILAVTCEAQPLALFALPSPVNG